MDMQFLVLLFIECLNINNKDTKKTKNSNTKLIKQMTEKINNNMAML